MFSAANARQSCVNMVEKAAPVHVLVVIGVVCGVERVQSRLHYDLHSKVVSCTPRCFGNHTTGTPYSHIVDDAVRRAEDQAAAVPPLTASPPGCVEELLERIPALRGSQAFVGGVSRVG